MTIQKISGSPLILVGGSNRQLSFWGDSGISMLTLGAETDAGMWIGQIKTSDGGSHTLDTSGSSSIGWRVGTNSLSGTVAIGLADVQYGEAAPGRAAHSGGIISFDVYRSMSSGITASDWNEHVPNAGSKTIADGDIVALAVQIISYTSGSIQFGGQNATIETYGWVWPQPTKYVYPDWTRWTTIPNCRITFSDGAYGYFYGGDALKNVRQNSTVSNGNEGGNFIRMPVPMRIFGIGWHGILTDDVIARLYSDPLGTPILRKSSGTVPKRAVSSTGTNPHFFMFPTPYDAAANEALGAVLYNAGSTTTINTQYHEVYDVECWRPHPVNDCYHITRSGGSGAFSGTTTRRIDAGVLVGGFDGG